MMKRLALVTGALAILGVGILIGATGVRSALAEGKPEMFGQTMSMMNTPGHKAMQSGETAKAQEACITFMGTDEGKPMMQGMMGSR